MLADPKVCAAAAVSRHAIQRRQDAAEDAHRRDVSEPRARPHERRRVLFRGGARVGVDRRRAVAARHVAAAAGARAHRRQPARSSRAIVNAPRFKKIGGLQGDTTDARAARVREGSSGRGLPAAPPVHGLSRRSRRRSRRRRISTSSCATRCETITPLVRFLNEPLVASQQPDRRAHSSTIVCEDEVSCRPSKSERLAPLRTRRP